MKWQRSYHHGVYLNWAESKMLEGKISEDIEKIEFWGKNKRKRRKEGKNLLIRICVYYQHVRLVVRSNLTLHVANYLLRHSWEELYV